MTTDELVELCQALVGDLTLAQARKGLGVAKNLDDDQFILLMRFMAGERPRPEANTIITSGTYSRAVLDRFPDLADEDDEDPNQTVLDFSGVTLY